ncbi:MAG: tetratricopeptide repeat protein [Ardenticatenaceae bacterium]|nr:tetratricopeptide repeat protein [Ardenticatenaceae bacterium]MCB8989030.1 tetratricopeptide repeat protein [Ardenticatenaceae bacterium]
MSETNTSSKRRPTPKELRLSIFLPIAITLAIWVVGAVILVIVPQQLYLGLGLLIGISLVIYLIVWTRRARTSLRIVAILFALPALVGLSWGTITGSFTYTFTGLLITFVLLLLQRVLNTPLSYRAAYRSFSRGDYEMALDLISKSITARPDFWQSYQLRALIYLMKMNFIHAERDAQKAADLNPGAHPVYNTLGQIYLAQNRFEAAEEMYAVALTYAPDYALYNYHLGLSQYRQGKYEAAAAALAAATQGTLPQDEYDLQACYYLGRSLERQQQAAAGEAFAEMAHFSAALPMLRRQISHLPEYPHKAMLQADVEEIEQRLVADNSREN